MRIRIYNYIGEGNLEFLGGTIHKGLILFNEHMYVDSGPDPYGNVPHFGQPFWHIPHYSIRGIQDFNNYSFSELQQIYSENINQPEWLPSDVIVSRDYHYFNAWNVLKIYRNVAVQEGNIQTR